MILITQKTHKNIFLVLVPHRDVRLVLRNYSNSLFGAGYSGAYHFPWVAPLALLSQAFNTDELKNCAHILREAVGEGKINSCEASSCVFAADTALFGPRIDIGILPDSLGGAAKKATEFFTQPIIGACLLSSAENAAFLPPPPQISFRAAAVANMYWRPMKTGASVVGYKWKIGKLCWLPKTGSRDTKTGSTVERDEE